MGSVEARSDSESFVWRPDTGIEGPSISDDKVEDGSSKELYLAASESDSTFSGVKNALEGKDADTNSLRPSDVERRGDEIFVDGVEASDFDGSIFYRPNTWFSDLSEEDKVEKMGLMSDLESEYDVDFYGGAQSALISRDKKATKNVYKSKGVDTVEGYSFDEALNVLEDGGSVVAKPRKGTCQGDYVELVESGEELEEYMDRVLGDDLAEEDVGEHLLFEEYLETGSDADNSDMRMVVLNGEIYRKERSGGDGIANNLDNNGRYVEAPDLSDEEKELAEETQEIFGNGFYAVDYIRDEEGEVKVLENNATPGTQIGEELEIDLDEKIAGEAYRTEKTAETGSDTYQEPQNSVII
jgi:hypothetical protein